MTDTETAALIMGAMFLIAFIVLAEIGMQNLRARWRHDDWIDAMRRREARRIRR